MRICVNGRDMTRYTSKALLKEATKRYIVASENPVQAIVIAVPAQPRLKLFFSMRPPAWMSKHNGNSLVRLPWHRWNCCTHRSQLCAMELVVAWSNRACCDDGRRSRIHDGFRSHDTRQFSVDRSNSLS